MKVGVFLLVAYCLAGAAAVSAAEFVPGGYQSADGAIVLAQGGDYVEPYFATKALLAAQDGGLDARRAALAWISWALPRQGGDGRFDRFCRKPAGEWKRCGSADADDSMLALWVQLLYRFAPAGGLPPKWQSSAAKASAQLAALRNSRLHVYHVSRRNHTALLMDNLEVYAALNEIGGAQARLGDREGAVATKARADELAGGIRRVFWDGRKHYFRPSMQKTQPGFYPDGVAQLFPVLTGFAFPDESWQIAWRRWKRQFGKGWIDEKYDPHPWGLVALAAMKLNDADSVSCWLEHAGPLRYSQQWNVLEEAIFQALERRSQMEAANPRACVSAMRS